MAYCVVTPFVRNNNGELVESKLFKDLSRYLPDRNSVKKAYALSKDNDFLDSIYDKVDFDENGEITMDSLVRYGKINLDEEKTLSSLNKELKSGAYEYNEALDRLRIFNTENPLKRDYMATMVRESKSGKYNVFVTKRTDSSEIDLQDQIKNKSIQDSLIEILTRFGVSVEFLDNPDFNGRYSTENAEKTANGLYNLIKIANGANIDETLAEETGHFAVASLGNSPLVERLLNLLTPEVQKQIFGEEYETKNMGSNAARETAGYLVGKAILNKLENKTPWQKLVHRIMNLIKNIFSTSSGDDVLNAIEKAKQSASAIAEGFLLGNTEYNIENALNIKETLFDAKISKNNEILNVVSKKFSRMMKQLEAAGEKQINKEIKAIIADSMKHTFSDSANQSTYDVQCIDGIITGLKWIDDMVGEGKQINRLLDSVKIIDGKEFFSRMAEDGRSLQKVDVFLQNAFAIVNAVEHAIPDEGVNIDSLTDIDKNKYEVNLKSLVNELKYGLNAIKKILTAKQTEFFLSFLEHQYGNKFIRSSAKILFKAKSFLKLEKTEARDISLRDILRGGDDISIFHRFIASASNGGVITQIADKCTKLANKKADDKTNELWDKLRILNSRFERLGINSRNLDFMYEKIIDEHGNERLTGNIISEIHYGKWEEDYNEMLKDVKRQFKDKIMNETLSKKIDNWEKLKDTEKENEFKLYWSKIDDTLKGIMFDEFARPLIKEFHKEHSFFDREKEKYLPNLRYDNGKYSNKKQFEEIIKNKPEIYSLYVEYMNIKEDIDRILPEGSTHLYRIPQFKGTFSNQIKNLESEGQKHSRWKSFWRTQILEKFCDSSEDRDYGSEQTVNDETDIFAGNTHDKDEERVNRLPLFGINKLANMSELSTNLLSSTLAYGGMAYTYEALDGIVGALEVGKNVMRRRVVKGNMSDDERSDVGLKPSRDYSRYLKFLDKQVYGIGSTKHFVTKKVVVEKSIQTMTGFASKYFLAGNVVGGLVNLGTGATEIFREALAKEFFTVNDWKIANKLYFQGFVDNWADFGSNNTDNKTALFIRHFNIRGENKQDYREWNRHNRIYNIMGKSLMMPYTSGDHYIQCISYLALANNTKVIDEKGNEIPLYEAYKVVKNVDKKGNENGYTLKLNGNFFINQESRNKFNKLKKLYEILSENEQNISELSDIAAYLEEDRDLINELKLTEENFISVENVKNILNRYRSGLIWNEENESKLMDKAREINNRMHGIYNQQDKTALHQNFLGAAFLAMKGWAVGQAERLFSPSHYSVALESNVEGSLVTLAKVIANTSFKDAKGLGRTLMMMTLPWSKKTEQMMLAEGFDEFQIANMRRNVGDFALLAGLLLLISIFKGMKGKDDDESDGVAGFLYYMSSRLYREGAALRLPKFWAIEKDNLLDIQPVFMAAIEDIINTSMLIVGTPFASEDNSKYYYKTNVPGKAKKGDPKFVYRLQRATPFLKSYYPMTHGYNAYESYVYGQKIKSR